ncbi:extensin-like [Portunus trituberculatus]|uniref:extensin-like n=1 Tax=Portunus trituberculatus TaxID=210409 RepID=UPI001E1CD828|nr:extensin-like [Portunus trituberculatus]
MREMEGKAALWWLGPFQPPHVKNLYTECPAPKKGWGSSLPVVGPILAARRTAQHVACLQATRATLQQQHLLFTARCLVWWAAGVLLAVLQRLLWPRLRQPRVPRPAGPEVTERPGTGQPNLILYGAVSPQQVSAAMRCAWHYHLMMRLHRHLHRPHTKALPSTTALQHRLAPTPITASAPSPAVFKCSAETFMPHVAAALLQTGVAGRAPNTPPPPSHLPPVTAASPRRCLPTGHLTASPPLHQPSSPSQRLLPIAASPPDMSHPPRHFTNIHLSASGVSSQTPPSKLSRHTPPILRPSPPESHTSPPDFSSLMPHHTLCPNHPSRGHQHRPPRTFSPRFQRPQQTHRPPRHHHYNPVPLTNTGPNINTNPLTNHVHNIPTVPHTTHGPHTSRRHV